MQVWVQKFQMSFPMVVLKSYFRFLLCYWASQHNYKTIALLNEYKIALMNIKANVQNIDQQSPAMNQKNKMASWGRVVIQSTEVQHQGNMKTSSIISTNWRRKPL